MHCSFHYRNKCPNPRRTTHRLWCTWKLPLCQIGNLLTNTICNYCRIQIWPQAILMCLIYCKISLFPIYIIILHPFLWSAIPCFSNCYAFFIFNALKTFCRRFSKPLQQFQTSLKQIQYNNIFLSSKLPDCPHIRKCTKCILSTMLSCNCRNFSIFIPELLRALLFYQYKISNILYMLHHNHTTNIFHHTAQSVPGTFFHKQLFPALPFRFFSAM